MSFSYSDSIGSESVGDPPVDPIPHCPNAAPSLGSKMLSNKKRTPISSRCSPPTVQSWHSNLVLMKANVQHVHTVIIDHPNCSKPSSLTWSRVSYPASEEFMAGLLVPLCFPKKTWKCTTRCWPLLLAAWLSEANRSTNCTSPAAILNFCLVGAEKSISTQMSESHLTYHNDHLI